MGSLVIHMVHNSKLFIASTIMSWQPKVAHDFHIHELFITSKALISNLRVIHVNLSLRPLIIYISLSLQPYVIHVIHRLELFITFRALVSRPEIVHIIHNLGC